MRACAAVASARESSERTEPGPAQVALGVLVGILAISTAAPMVRFAEPLDHGVIAAGRVFISALGLAFIAPKPTLEALRRCVGEPNLAGRVALAGVLLGIHFASWIAAVALTSILRAVVLVSLQPIFAALVGRVLGDRATWRLWISIAVAIGGTALMVSGEPDPAGRASLLGDALAVLGALSAAVYLSVGRSVGERLPLPGYFALVNVAALVTLGVVLLIRQPTLWPAEALPIDLVGVLWLGLVPGLLGHGALNWAVRRVPVVVVSLAVLLEPIGAALIAWWWLGEPIGLREGAGAVLLLGGVAVGIARRSGAEREPASRSTASDQ